MKNILIPTDFSANSWNAIIYALALFKNNPCNFHLLHINEISSYNYDVEAYVPPVEALVTPSKQELSAMLKRIERLYKNASHRFFMINDQDFFIDAIRKHVEEKRIDLIVMGTKGTTGLKEFVIGSNTGHVITKVKCNTLVVPENAKFQNLNEVAFATDYTIFYSTTILATISELLQTNNANIRVVHVTKRNEQLNELQKSNKEYLKDYLNEISEDSNSFHNVTNKNVTEAIDFFVESRDLDMIVMVAKNLNFLQQLLFNSKIQEISFHTTLPFMVLHE